MWMLEPSLFARGTCVAAFLLIAGGASGTELQMSDLKNLDKVSAALANDLTYKQAMSHQAFVNEAIQAGQSERYGPAYKAWGAATLIQPNAANLAMMAESMLREVGMSTDAAHAEKRRSTVLPASLQFFAMALASEQIKPVLGESKKYVIGQQACIKDYLEKSVASPSCEPLIWSGVVR
jgi:hypothetical protein